MISQDLQLPRAVNITLSLDIRKGAAPGIWTRAFGPSQSRHWLSTCPRVQEYLIVPGVPVLEISLYCDSEYPEMCLLYSGLGFQPLGLRPRSTDCWSSDSTNVRSLAFFNNLPTLLLLCALLSASTTRSIPYYWLIQGTTKRSSTSGFTRKTPGRTIHSIINWQIINQLASRCKYLLTLLATILACCEVQWRFYTLRRSPVKNISD